MSTLDEGRALWKRVSDGRNAEGELTRLLVAARNECVAGSPRGQAAAYDCAQSAAIRYGIGTEAARALIDEADRLAAEDDELLS